MEVNVTTLNTTVYVVTDDTGRVTVTQQDPSPGQAGITFEDEGVSMGTRGTVNEIDFVGSGVAAVRTGDKVTVTITSGGGSGDVVGPAVAVNDNIAVFNGTTGKIIKDGGAAIPSLTNLSTTLVFLSAAAGQAITNQPVGETFFISSNRHVFKFDATKYTAARLMVNVTTLSASPNLPRLYAKWKTTFATGDAVGTYTTLGTGSGSETCSLAAVDVVASDWITLPAGAKADVFWTCAEIGGDGAADPVVGQIFIQFRV